LLSVSGNKVKPGGEHGAGKQSEKKKNDCMTKGKKARKKGRGRGDIRVGDARWST